MMASNNDHKDVVRILVNAGADLNLVNIVRKYFKYKSYEIFLLFVLYYFIFIIGKLHSIDICLYA